LLGWRFAAGRQCDQRDHPAQLTSAVARGTWGGFPELGLGPSRPVGSTGRHRLATGRVGSSLSGARTDLS
jgi:hypothetical protein